MFGFFKKDESETEMPSGPEYPVVSNLRIGATLNPEILDIDLAKANGESVLLEKMQETLIISQVDYAELEGVKVHRYLTTSGEMVELVIPDGARPEEDAEVIFYTVFDQIGFASEADLEDWLAEGSGHMGQPVFSIMPEEGSDESIEFHRMINDHSEHWAHPVELEMEEFTGNPYNTEDPIEKTWSERKMMVFARDLPSIKSYLQLLMELDEKKGVIHLYVGIPVKLNDLNIT